MLVQQQSDILNKIKVNQHSFNFETLKSYISQAERRFIIPAISQAFYDELVSGLGSHTGDKATALDKIYTALAFYTFYIYAPQGMVVVGAQGIQEANNNESNHARQWVTEKYKTSLLESGDDALEDLLAFMENAGGTAFNTWKSSDAYTVVKSLLIENADQLNNEVNVKNSRRTFLAFKNYINQAQRYYILPILGETLYNKIISDKKAGSLQDPYKTVAQMCRPALANFALYRATLFLPLRISDQGITIRNKNDSINEVSQASNEKLFALGQQAEMDGNSELETLKKYLNDNADSITEFKDSKYYDDPNKEPEPDINSKMKGGFAV